MSEWTRKTIAECADNEPYSTQIGPFGKALTPEEYTLSGVPLLRGVNVNHGRFYDDGFVFISEKTANRLYKYESFPGDVLLVHKGTLGQIGLMPKKRKYHRYIMGNSMLRVKCDEKKLMPEYLYYWLCSREGQHYLLSRVSQVGVPQIQKPLATLREASLLVPSLNEQKAITHILETIDNKIENLRRQNETLEQIAQTLFKHWFIDFEFPNADGKPYKSSGGAMSPSELGDIPEGWRVGKLGDVGKNIRDGVKESEIKPDMSYIGLEHIPRKQIALDSWGKALDIASNKFWFNKGNILFGKLRPYFHKVGIAFTSGVCSTDILVIEHKQENYFGFLLMLLSSDQFIHYVSLASEGTRMPRTSWEYMKDYSIIIPQSLVLESFNNLFKPFIKKMEINIYQIQTLTKTRDALLPKLMSGQLRVKE